MKKENQLTILGLLSAEVPQTYFDKVPFTNELMVIEVGKKDSIGSACQLLIKKYPQFDSEINSFNDVAFVNNMNGNPLLDPNDELESAFLYLTVL